MERGDRVSQTRNRNTAEARSALEYGSPLPLSSTAGGQTQSGTGVPHSKALRAAIPPTALRRIKFPFLPEGKRQWRVVAA
jgi:hypothetical protein